MSASWGPPPGQARPLPPDTAAAPVQVWRWFTRQVRVDRRELTGCAHDLAAAVSAVQAWTPVTRTEAEARDTAAAALDAIAADLHRWGR